jgi:DNA invertase Pin-like site-specific DNA recombinase
MNKELIMEEILKIQDAPFAFRTDKQLWASELLSQLYKERNNGQQPVELIKFNKTENRSCKLNREKVTEIRRKYSPHVYGKARLAKEYGVSVSVIYRIIQRKSWKEDH